MKETRKFFVVSHTHWDREWYKPFSAFRFQLGDLINRLLDIMEEYPDYIFHLDGQTVVLEDYLETYPQKRELLRRHITAGNLIVGPWYLQNDFWLTSGESTVRNLLIGREIMYGFGGESDTGYAPDQFGHFPQMPQIINGFGLNAYVFARGYTFHKPSEYKIGDRSVTEPGAIDMPFEFIWRAKDGTGVLAVLQKAWYNNAQRIPAELDRAKKMLDVNAGALCEGVSPYVLLMNGSDHIEAQDDLLPVLESLRGAGYDVKQGKLDDYILMLTEYIKNKGLSLPEYSGALMRGHDWDLVRGCWSSRSYLKVANVKCQNMLESVLEPLYSCLELEGFEGVYDDSIFKYIWKELLKNHPHDNICGCSCDIVHTHMEDSYKKISEMCGEILRRGLELAAAHTPAYSESDSDYKLMVFNPHAVSVGGVLRTTVEIPAAEKIKGFDIFDIEGNKLEYHLIKKSEGLKDVFSPLNLPGVINTDNFEIELLVPPVKPLSADAFSVVATPEKRTPARVEATVLENKFFKIWYDDGVNITDKHSGKTVYGAVLFEECAERGDAYAYLPTPDPFIYSGKAKSFSYGASPLEQTLTVKLSLNTPKYYDFKNFKRKGKAVNDITYTIRLKKDSPIVEIEYDILNDAGDHRLRMLIDTGIESDTLFTDSAFSVDAHTEAETLQNPFLNNFHGFCNATFAAVCYDGDREGGAAVFSEGLHECEQLGTKLAFTVVRTTGVIGRKINGESKGGAVWDIPENQGFGRRYKGRLGFYSFEGDLLSARVYDYAKFFTAGLIHHYTSNDPKKFSGGRFAVQDAALAGIYYIPDKYAGVCMRRNSAFELDNPAVAVSAFKKSFDGSGLVVRLVNLSEQPQSCTFAVQTEISQCRLDETGRMKIGTGAVKLEFRSGEIKTLYLTKAE